VSFYLYDCQSAQKATQNLFGFCVVIPLNVTGGEIDHKSHGNGRKRPAGVKHSTDSENAGDNSGEKCDSHKLPPFVKIEFYNEA